MKNVIHKFAPDFFRGQGRRGPRPVATFLCCEDRRPKPDEEIGRKRVQSKRKKIRANGGCLGYPEAMKDVVSCEKARGSANRN